MKNQVAISTRLWWAAAALAVIVAACGDTSSTADVTTGQPGPTAEVATTTPPEPEVVETTVPSASEADLLALGEEVYQVTAGGIGCKSCHGTDGLGDIGPAIIGKSAETIRIQLDFNENMFFIILTDEEIEAVAAYLKVLQREYEERSGG
jgi:mono/diheme cytochrome c family protein